MIFCPKFTQKQFYIIVSLIQYIDNTSQQKGTQTFTSLANSDAYYSHKSSKISTKCVIFENQISSDMSYSFCLE